PFANAGKYYCSPHVLECVCCLVPVTRRILRGAKRDGYPVKHVGMEENDLRRVGRPLTRPPRQKRGRVAVGHPPLSSHSGVTLIFFPAAGRYAAGAIPCFTQFEGAHPDHEKVGRAWCRK